MEAVAIGLTALEDVGSLPERGQRLDLALTTAPRRLSAGVNLALTLSNAKAVVAMDLSLTAAIFKHLGYIAGTEDGIVNFKEQGLAREIMCFCLENAPEIELVARVWSLDNGHYLIPYLDASKQYLLIARDYQDTLDPTGADYINPATNLSKDELGGLWKKMQQS